VISGSGSTLNGGDTTIGNGGSGALAITNGGVANNTNTTIAKQTGSSGTATVDGSGSQLNNTGTLDVGPAGSGALNLTNGGAATANGGTTVGLTGTIMGNGTITTPTLINNGTVAPAGPNNTLGTLTINGNYQQGQAGTLDTGVSGQQSFQADQLKVAGAASLNGTLALTSLNNFHPAPGATYTLMTAAGGVTGNFTGVVDKLNTTGLTRSIIVAPNGFIVSYLRPAPTPTAVTVRTTKSLPSTPLTAAQKNAILLPVLNPDVEQLAAPFDIWFSLANTQRFNLEARFDDVIAGSTGFVSNVTYPVPPPTGKEPTEGKGVVTGKGRIGARLRGGGRRCVWRSVVG
jgi:T5SS/PEP-CTERM-associated repeat protein